MNSLRNDAETLSNIKLANIIRSGDSSENSLLTPIGLGIATGSSIGLLGLNHLVDVDPEIMNDLLRLRTSVNLPPREFANEYANIGHKLINSKIKYMGKDTTGYDFIKSIRSGPIGQHLTNTGRLRATWDDLARDHYDSFAESLDATKRRMMYEAIDGGDLLPLDMFDHSDVSKLIKDWFAPKADRYGDIHRALRAIGLTKNVLKAGIVGGLGLGAAGLLLGSGKNTLEEDS